MIIKMSSGFAKPDPEVFKTLAHLPMRAHVYGQNFPSADEPCWLAYSKHILNTPFKGYLSFLRKPHLLFPELSQYTIDYLSNVIDTEITPDSINIMRSIGTCIPHIDTSRATCINIGIKNTEKGITRMGLNDSYEDYELNYNDHIIEEGSAYLVNVSNVHGVYADQTTVRYLINISLHEPFDLLRTKIK